ncbi:MAG: Flp pilus assembly complex ATPase component TadA [Candidatus Riflebacteria bacterium]|nr:Flp pilus assembly complex ATPase component TadA [Candidatus Riflebacteria bacterium]
MDLKALIESVHRQGGSEIHLKVGAPPLMRQNKNLKRLQIPNVIQSDLDGIINEYLSAIDKQKLQESKDFENNYFDQASFSFRLNIFRSQGQIQIKIHLIKKDIMQLEEIGFPETFSQLLDSKSGLIILSGPSRSGISTSLAAMIERINKTRESHILVLEDPIENVFKSKKSIITQRQIRKDVQSIEQGITFAKRMDVDVLALGDIRKELPLKSIIDYVDGGHLVIATMQTLGIQNTLEKILSSFFVSDRPVLAGMLAHDLLGICSQTLIFNPIKQIMVPIHEIMTMNHIMRGIIQKEKIAQIESNINSAGPGSRLFDAHIGKLVLDNIISKEIADSFLATYRAQKG